MKVVRIRDIASVAGGGTPRRSVAQYYGGSIPWVTPKDMKAPVITGSQVNLTDAGLKNSPAKLVPPGSTLVVVRSGVLKHTLPVAINAVAVCLNQDMKALMPNEDVHAPWLAKLVKSLQPTVLSWVRATTADNFPIDNLLDLQVELPPLTEQRRIATILDQAEKIRDCRFKLSVHLEELAMSIFDQRFASGVYPSLRLGQIAEIKGGKRLPRGEIYAESPTDHPYVRVVDLRADGTIDTQGLRFISEDVHRRVARYVVANGEVVISIAGTIGLVAAVPEELVGANLTENAARIVPRSGEDYRAEWLAAALRTPSLQNQIRGLVGQATIGKLALFKIEKLELEVPPIKAQDEYLNIVRAVRKVAKRVAGCVTFDKELSASLRAQAFSGHL